MMSRNPTSLGELRAHAFILFLLLTIYCFFYVIILLFVTVSAMDPGTVTLHLANSFFAFDIETFASLMANDVKMSHETNGTMFNAQGKERVVQFYREKFFSNTTDLQLFSLISKPNWFECHTQAQKDIDGRKEMTVFIHTTTLEFAGDKIVKMTTVVSKFLEPAP